MLSESLLDIETKTLDGIPEIVALDSQVIPHESKVELARHLGYLIVKFRCNCGTIFEDYHHGFDLGLHAKWELNGCFPIDTYMLCPKCTLTKG